MRMSDWSSDVCSFDLGRAQDVGDEDDAHSQGRAGGKRDGGGDAAFTETPAEKESRNIWWWQEEAISAWFEAGGREDDFWATTPLNVQRFLIGYNKRKDAAHNDIRWLAWHIEALNRQKRLPSFNEMMGVAPKAMDEDEIEKMLDLWVSRHNAKVPDAEKHYEVMEVD